MVSQLSKLKKKSKTSSPKKVRANQPPYKKSGDNGLGYEVLYGRRASAVQVPLSVTTNATAASKAYSSTGSALLDSFVSEAVSEPVPLQHLRLINVANRQRKPKSAATVLDSPLGSSKASAAPSAKRQPAVIEPPSPSEHDAIKAKVVKPPAAAKPAKTQLKDNRHRQSAPAAPTPTTPAPTARSTAADSTPTTASKTAATAASSKAVKPKIPAAKKLFQPKAASLAPSAPLSPTFSAAGRTSKLTQDSKLARDNAAAVGLIDTDDTLLFGGDHQNLAVTDPFIDSSHQSESETGVLSYITQQVSAFTVSKLKSGFPNNTDPRVINRPDPPKHKTVLDIQSFQLGDLDEDSTARPQASLQSMPQQQPEIGTLSQQVDILNQKIAELSKKLAQVTQEQTDAND
ncbi:MAG: hypothetical protein AAGL17_03925 [Cyanobacteria bacterium J06576_12]